MSDSQPPTPSQPKASTVSLPLTFANSFWSSDYRSGFVTCYSSLSHGIHSSTQLLAHIARRATSEKHYAASLLPQGPPPSEGFSQLEGSLKLGYEALVGVSQAEARARLKLAEELERGIAGPFGKWSVAHQGRVESSKALIEGHLSAYESSLTTVKKTKSAYDEACRAADSAEDELTFSGGVPAERAPTASTANSQLASPISAEDKGKGPESVLAPGARTARAEQGSDDGIGGSETEEEEEEGLVGRSGATGGSIASALGRAFTVRRKQLTAAATPTSPTSANGAEGGSPNGVEKILNDANVEAAVEFAKTQFSSLLSRVNGPKTAQERHDKARAAADAAEDKYKAAVLLLDTHRLSLEEALSEHLAYAHRCESDRLQAASSVMRSFQSAIDALPAAIAQAQERCKDTLAAMNPARDVRGVVERLKTGPFAPQPVVFSSHYSEPTPTVFGIDLRKYSETNPEGPGSASPPPVLGFLLEYLEGSYEGVTDEEKRKVHLYETPLAAQHHLRAALNHNGPTYDTELVKRFDLPVVASVLKLWLLELAVPVCTFAQYDEYRSLYPSRVGAESAAVPPKLLASHLSRLPPIHLAVLKLLIEHFAKLIEGTKTDESDEVYLQKLSLSFGRCLVRPRTETALTLDDRFPVLLFADLVRGSEEIWKAEEELRDQGEQGRGERYKPRRQRTKMVDVRLSRTNLAKQITPPAVPGQEFAKGSLLEKIDTKEALEALKEQKKRESMASSTSGASAAHRVLPVIPQPISTTLPAQEDAQQPLSSSPVEAQHSPLTHRVLPPAPAASAPPADESEEPFVPPAQETLEPSAPPAASSEDEGGAAGALSPTLEQQPRAGLTGRRTKGPRQMGSKVSAARASFESS